MSGVEIHANAIDTLYAGRSISEAPDLLLLVSLFLYVILLWWMDRRFEGRRFYVASLVTGPGMLIVSWALMKYAQFVVAVSAVLGGARRRRAGTRSDETRSRESGPGSKDRPAVVRMA